MRHGSASTPDRNEGAENVMPEVPADVQEELSGVSPEDRWEYVGYKLLMLEQAVGRIERMMNEAGQKVTNIDHFCAETREAVTKMSANPLLRGMGIPRPNPAPRPLPGLLQ